MTINEVLNDKTLKAKGKVTLLGDWLIKGQLPVEELLACAEKQKGTQKATCIETLEYATKKQPVLGSESLLAFVTETLKDEEPRIKWESAKVIANIATLFPDQSEKAIPSLLLNAENKGTVVRWATASALVEIIRSKAGTNKKLLSKIKLLVEKEEDNAVKKKYLALLKTVKK